MGSGAVALAQPVDMGAGDAKGSRVISKDQGAAREAQREGKEARCYVGQVRKTAA